MSTVSKEMYDSEKEILLRALKQQQMDKMARDMQKQRIRLEEKTEYEQRVDDFARMCRDSENFSTRDIIAVRAYTAWRIQALMTSELDAWKITFSAFERVQVAFNNFLRLNQACIQPDPERSDREKNECDSVAMAVSTSVHAYLQRSPEVALQRLGKTMTTIHGATSHLKFEPAKKVLKELRKTVDTFMDTIRKARAATRKLLLFYQPIRLARMRVYHTVGNVTNNEDKAKIIAKHMASVMPHRKYIIRKQVELEESGVPYPVFDY